MEVPSSNLHTDPPVRSPLSPMSKSMAYGLGSEMWVDGGVSGWLDEEEERQRDEEERRKDEEEEEEQQQKEEDQRKRMEKNEEEIEELEKEEKEGKEGKEGFKDEEGEEEEGRTRSRRSSGRSSRRKESDEETRRRRRRRKKRGENKEGEHGEGKGRERKSNDEDDTPGRPPRHDDHHTSDHDASHHRDAHHTTHHTSHHTSHEKSTSPRQATSPRVVNLVNASLHRTLNLEQIFHDLMDTMMGGETGEGPKDWDLAEELISALPALSTCVGEWKRTALHYACSNQAPPDVIRALVTTSNQGGITCKSTWRSGSWLPLHCAAACDLPVDSTEILLEKYPKAANLLDDSGRTPLHLACRYQSGVQLVQLLLRVHEHGARETDDRGRLPIHLALERPRDTRWDVVRVLLQSTGAEKQCKLKDEKDGTRSLHWACRHRAPVDVVQLMLDAYPRAVRKPDGSGRTALHWCCRREFHGEQAPVTGGSDWDPNSGYVKPPVLEIVELLLKVYPHAAREVDTNGNYPLFSAYEYQEQLPNSVRDALIRVYPEAEESFRGSEGMRSLIDVMGGPEQDGPTDWIEAHRLIQEYPETLRRTGPWGMTALHMASRAAAPPTIIASLLQKLPRAVRTLDRGGRLPLHGASAHPSTSLASLSLLLDANPDAVRVRDHGKGYLPLHWAATCRAPFENLVALLDVWPEAAGETSSRKKLGTLPMQLALAPYHMPLFDRDGDGGGGVTHDGREATVVGAPIMHGVERRTSREENATRAIDHLAEIDLIERPHGEPPMWDVIDLLLRAHPPSAREVDNEDGMLPLHVAARMHAPFELMEDLLSAHPRATRVEDRRGKLPLHWALQTRADMRTINALFEVYPEAASSVSVDLDHKIIVWQAEQPGMPGVERRKEEILLKRQRLGIVKGNGIKVATQLNAGGDGAHHQAPVVLNGNFGLSKYYLTEWKSQNQSKEGYREKKLYESYGTKKNKFRQRRIIEIHSSSNRCKLCWNAQLDRGENVTGEKFLYISQLIQHMLKVHDVEARIK